MRLVWSRKPDVSSRLSLVSMQLQDPSVRQLETDKRHTNLSNCSCKSSRSPIRTSSYCDPESKLRRSWTRRTRTTRIRRQTRRTESSSCFSHTESFLYSLFPTRASSLDIATLSQESSIRWTPGQRQHKYITLFLLVYCPS